MKYLAKAYEQTEIKLRDARSRLAAAAYCAWQKQRLDFLDTQLGGLATARADYEALKRIYNEARDRHRAERQRLRRTYYKVIKIVGTTSSPQPGIEQKAADVVARASPFLAGDLEHLLISCDRARRNEVESAQCFCRAHDELRRVLGESAALAEKLLARAEAALNE